MTKEEVFRHCATEMMAATTMPLPFGLTTSHYIAHWVKYLPNLSSKGFWERPVHIIMLKACVIIPLILEEGGIFKPP